MSTTTDAPAVPKHVAGLWTLASSMIHGGDTVLGTTRLFRTKGWIHDGRKLDLPVVSGNAIRGHWRRHCAEAFLDAWGEPVSLSAFYFLTSGGSLKKGGSTGGLDMRAMEDLRTLVPHVALFGGAGLGRIQPGTMYVDEAVPICRETVNRLARIWPGVREAETADMSIKRLTEVHGYSRQDDAKDPTWHRYLTEDGRTGAEAMIEHTESSEVARDAGTPQQMRYENVELVAGAVFFHRFGFKAPPSREALAGFAAGLLRWAERPHAGGRNAVGHGNLLVNYTGMNVETKLLGDGTEPLATFERDEPDAVLRDHVEGHRDAIGDVLEAL